MSYLNRRRFLYGTSALGVAFAVHPRIALSAPVKRGAVTIGVDSVDHLPKLKAAASGATAVAKWLAAEGFEVKNLVDTNGPIKASDVFDAVAGFVNRGTLEQLVVYFAGHGFNSHYAEFWLLSGAPDNPNEAISVIESITLAKQSAIPNVVIISDACRSRADTLRTDNVRGSLVFPNGGGHSSVIPDVDVLYATVVGDPAFEVPVQDSTAAYSGIFTAALLDAYRKPDPSMIVPVDGKPVVPNHRLRPYLTREVPRRARVASVTIDQHPDIQVVSDEPTYIGHVTSAERANLNSDPAVLPSISEVAAAAIAAVDGLGFSPSRDEGPLKSWTPTIPGSASLARVAQSSGFSASANQIVQARGLTAELLIQTGIQITGSAIASVRAAPDVLLKTSSGENGATLIEVGLSGARRAATVCVRFANGSGFAFVALRNYIGSVVVDPQGVSSVTYVPSRSNPYREGLNDARLAELHALVATAARYGAFRIDGGRKNRTEAERLGDRIRVLKGYDATLGIYAAYAYAQADDLTAVGSVRAFMRSGYGVDLFDLALLSGTPAKAPAAKPLPVLPPFPLLTQGWALLRVKNVHLPGVIAEAQGDLRSSLWTTFGPRGMSQIEPFVLSVG